MIPAILESEAFEQALREQLESEIRQFPPRSWWPSHLGHPCDRFLVWSFTRWQDAERHDWVLQAIFDEGRLHQPAILDRLTKMGFEVLGEPVRPTEYKVGGSVIAGKPDMYLRGYKGARFAHPIPGDAKSMQGHAWTKLNSVEDLRASVRPWERGYYDQVNTYCFLENEPVGTLVLKSKATGLLKVLPFEWDPDAAESSLRRIERLQPMVEQGQDPPAMPYDAATCGRCAFRGHCYPPKILGEGASIITDEELIENLERRETLVAAKKQYDALDRAIKARLKREGIQLAVAGDFLIQGLARAVRGFTVAARVDVVYTVQRLGDQVADTEQTEGI